MLPWFLAACGSPHDSATVQARAHVPASCGDALVIDQTWSIESKGEASASVASLLAEGKLLMGCEDQLPPMQFDQAGSRLILASVDELSAQQRAHLENHFEVSLTDIHEQGYVIGWRRDGILIAGGTRQGLVYGAMAWLQSLDHVQTVDGAWAPDPHSEFTARNECSDYDGSCLGDASCWRGGWSPVEAVTWCPETVSDHPAIDVRMGFASFKGTMNAHFVPNIVGVELGTCDQPDETSVFWAATIGCERGVGTCNDVLVRLDTLVSGRFTHALDEGYPVATGSTLQDLTGCGGALLYAELDRYLGDRGVELVPSVFGLETRVGDTPIAGPPLSLEDPYELWGAEGDVTLSEGFSVLPREMQVCALEGRLFLAEDCEDLDAEGHVAAPKAVTPRWDTDKTELPTELWKCDKPLGACQVAGCWSEVRGLRGLALQPDATCANPAIRVPMPIEEPYAGRLYALSFRALVTKTQDLRVKVVVKDSEGITNALDVAPLNTKREDSDYLTAKGDTLSRDAEWVRFSFVYRVPLVDDRVTEAYLQLLGRPGSKLYVDDIQLFEVDAQLPRIDASSVRVFGEEELGGDCITVEAGFEGALSVASYFDAHGAPLGPFGSIEIDPACASEGELVEVSYRTWIHAGLWPGLSVRQSHWTYAPGVYESGWWEHEHGPAGQLKALSDHGVDSDFVGISDLGGEARGFNRASAGYYETSASETLGSFVCGVQEALCDNSGGCAEAPDCSSMLADPLSEDFAPCVCAETVSERRLLVSGDMFTPWHNGGDSEGGIPGRAAYQVPHGGFVGGTSGARDFVPASTVFLSWWHYDVRRVGKDDGGHETLMSFVRDLTGAGLGVIGASAWDPDNARAWAALAAGTGRTHGFDVPGVAHFAWGTDRQGPRVMRQAGHYFWQPGWALVDDWLISKDAALPGGVESWTVSGAALEESDFTWPQTGALLRLGPTTVWDSPTVQLDSEWPKELLVRFHTELPAGCVVNASVLGTSSFSAEVRDVVVDRLDVTTARADVPESETEVAIRLAFEGCTDGTLDEVAIYQAVPGVPFPYRWQEEGLEDWVSPKSADSRYKVCGDGRTWDCKNHHTFRR